jgi:putative ATPase
MEQIEPLAQLLRPKSLQDYIGQTKVVSVLTKALESTHIPSCILWGPPGCGKTTLAKIIAKQSTYKYVELSAVSSGVKDVKDVIEQAKIYRKIVLFIDELHRFSKSQQDSLLHAVEQGLIILIGATTQNPSFEIIRPLLSRCQVFVLEPFSVEQLKLLTQKAQAYYASIGIQLHILEYEELCLQSGSDARKLYNCIEFCISQNITTITNSALKSLATTQVAAYDRTGEMHYDTISAFIKSVRGSDPQAAIYYLAILIESGEDPLFIARRLVVLASEDVGLANSQGLVVAQAGFSAVHSVGLPEARIILAHVTLFLTNQPKSNSAYLAIDSAIEYIKKNGILPIPLHLRNAPTQLLKELSYGSTYAYAHDYSLNGISHVSDQEYLPRGLLTNVFYKPCDTGKEQEYEQRLRTLWPKYFRSN